MVRVIVKTLLIAVEEGTESNELFDKINEALDGVDFVADWKISNVESEPFEYQENVDNFENLWMEIPDSQVLNLWASDTDEEMFADVPPTFYQESGTPVDPESGDDMSYIQTTVKL